MNDFVHRHKTAEWARAVGFPAGAAEAIGRADAEVDSLGLPRNQYHMRPALLLGPDRRARTAQQHLLQAQKAAAEGDRAQAWRHLGYGLHALQDQQAHGPWWFLGVHWFRWLDDPERTLWGRPDRRHGRLARIAAVSTHYLQQAWNAPPIRRCAEDNTAQAGR